MLFLPKLTNEHKLYWLSLPKFKNDTKCMCHLIEREQVFFLCVCVSLPNQSWGQFVWELFTCMTGVAVILCVLRDSSRCQTFLLAVASVGYIRKLLQFLRAWSAPHIRLLGDWRVCWKRIPTGFRRLLAAACPRAFVIGVWRL